MDVMYVVTEEYEEYYYDEEMEDENSYTVSVPVFACHTEALANELAKTVNGGKVTKVNVR